MQARTAGSPTVWHSAGAEVRRWMLGQRNRDGGWGYRPGRPSRLEPTCWALLATATPDRQVLEGWPRRDGLPVEGPSGAVNIAFAGLAAFTGFSGRAETHGFAEGVVRALGAVRGVRLASSEEVRQDNSLQGWPWMTDTFTWVEPTAWCLLALKRWRRLGGRASWLAARVDAGEAVLADRAIPTGGWNYGNPVVNGKVLSAFAPTTVVALLALRDRPRDPAVARSLQWLASHRLTETSGSALGLVALCLERFGVDGGTVRDRLVKSLDGVLGRGDVVAASHIGVALAGTEADDAFAL